MTRGELTAELAVTLGARHEARFIVDEVNEGASFGLDTDLAPAAIDRARVMAARRLRGEPLQYIFGHWAFRSLDLLVDPRVLIPRPETEQVVEVALSELGRMEVPAPTIVDAGTGSGAIGLSLAVEGAGLDPGGHVWATDASPEAIEVATANERRVRLAHAGSMLPVTILHGSWLTPLPAELRGAVDLVVSNPPYVAESEWADLAGDVRREPRSALVARDGAGGCLGLADIETVLAQAKAWLSTPGVAVVELAPHQAEAALVVARSHDYGDVRVEPDLAGRPRALVARLP